MILKSYNNGRGMKMTKKPVIDVEKCTNDASPLKTTNKLEKIGN
jgi:hypothetical protein